MIQNIHLKILSEIEQITSQIIFDGRLPIICNLIYKDFPIQINENVYYFLGEDTYIEIGTDLRHNLIRSISILSLDESKEINESKNILVSNPCNGLLIIDNTKFELFLNNESKERLINSINIYPSITYKISSSFIEIFLNEFESHKTNIFRLGKSIYVGMNNKYILSYIKIELNDLAQ